MVFALTLFSAELLITARIGNLILVQRGDLLVFVFATGVLALFIAFLTALYFTDKQILAHRIRKVCKIIFTVAVVNFVSFDIIGILIGGSAPHGKIEGGIYFVGNHGHYREVPYNVYLYSLIHAKSVFITHPLAILAGWIYVMTGADKQSKTRPPKSGYSYGLFSLLDAKRVYITDPLAILAGWIYVLTGADKQSKTRPPTRFQDPTATSSINHELSPEAFVKSYFDAINRRDYDSSWSMLSREFQENHIYNDYTSFWDTVDKVDILSTEIRSQNISQVLIYVETHYYYRNGTVTTEHTTFNLMKDGDSWFFDPK